MINPDSITNFKQNRRQLEEFISFWILVAGKTAHVTAPRLENMLRAGRIVGHKTPFALWRSFRNFRQLRKFLKEHGIGDYNKKAKALIGIANSDLDLKTCTLEDLDLYGMGQKTRRCFLIHSRPNQRLAGLDTQILKCLRLEYGYTDAPTKTPASDKQYRYWEEIVVDIFTREGRTAAEFDLDKWLTYRKPPAMAQAA